MNKEKIEKAKRIMEHWIEYEEKNKDKINKADELIGIQKTLLQYIAQLEQENKDLKEIKGMKEAIELAGMDMKSLLKFKYENEKLEQENKALKKGQNSLMSSRKKWKDRYYKLKAKNKKDIESWENVLDCAKYEINKREQENKDIYWKGYIQKQKEAVEICKICKYRKQYLERNAKKHG